MKTAARWRMTLLATTGAVASMAWALAAVLNEEPQTAGVFDRSLFEAYLSRRVATETDIVADYACQQAAYMPVLLPDAGRVLTQSGGLLPVVNWQGFAPDFVKRLVAVERDGATVWPIRVIEDARAQPRRRLVLNARGEVLAACPVPADYDPAWWVKAHYPDLYAASPVVAPAASRAALEALFDGSRLAMTYDLVDHDNLVRLVVEQTVAAARRAERPAGGGGVLPLLLQGGSVTNIQFVGMCATNVNGAVRLTVAYPDGFTNRISLIACTNALAPIWSLLTTVTPSGATNTFTHTDTGATTRNVRFYRAYNADYDGDGDGVADGEERFLDGTDPQNPNDPPNVKGTVSYAGGQAGTIYVVAVTTAGSWSTNKCARRSQPGGYVIPKLASGTYYIMAWRDSNGNGTANTNTEAFAIYPTTVNVNGQVTNVNLTLADPDTDADGLPDWWEWQEFPNLAHSAAVDEEPDGLNNLAEYLAGSDPEDADTDDDNMGDLAEIANGRNAAVADSYRSLTYTEGFESLTTGQISGQNGWTASPADKAVVQTAEKRSGSKALELLASTQTPTVNQFFGARGQNTVWLDYWAKLDPRAVTHFTNYADIAAAPAYDPAVFSINRRGEVWVFNGTAGTWSTDTRFRITDYRYHRFTVKENLTAKTWDLHIDGIKAFSAVPFRKFLPTNDWRRLASSAVLETQNTDLGGTSQNCSGCAIMPTTGELLVIQNDPEYIHVYTQGGAYRRTITLTEFDDTEGICHVQGNTYAVVEEKTNEVTLVTILTNTTSIAKSSGQRFDVNIGHNPDNLGLEGITYDPVRQVFYAVKEKSPKKVYRIELKNGIGYATELFAAPADAVAIDLSDIYYEPVQQHLFILSHESFKIVQTTLGGTIITNKAVSGSQPEGITIAPDRKTLFVISEPDDMYRYGMQPASGDYRDITEFSRFTAAGGRGGGWYVDDITVGTAQPSSLYGTLQTADIRVSANSDDAEEKCWNGGMELDGGTGSALDIGYKWSSGNNREESRIVGIAFTNGVARTSAVHRACIQFVARNISPPDDKKKHCPVRIEVQAVDNAPTFTTATANITSRTLTGRQVKWAPPGWRQLGESDYRHQTPDMAGLIRDVVCRGGWSPGNRMAFVITDELSGNVDAGRREAVCRELNANQAPLLHLEWAAPLP